MMIALSPPPSPRHQAMRVTNSAAPTAPNQGSSARTASAPAFALSRTPSVPAASPTGAAAQVAGLLALQDLPLSVDERRRQALRRGHGLLDALDQLERGLLNGIAAQPAVRRLRAELTQADKLRPGRRGCAAFSVPSRSAAPSSSRSARATTRSTEAALASRCRSGRCSRDTGGEAHQSRGRRPTGCRGARRFDLAGEGG